MDFLSTRPSERPKTPRLAAKRSGLVLGNDPLLALADVLAAARQCVPGDGQLVTIVRTDELRVDLTDLGSSAEMKSARLTEITLLSRFPN